MPLFEDRTVPLDRLLLDPNNFRFQDDPEFTSADANRFHEASVQTRAYQRLKPDGLLELKNSILKNGFLPVERIVARAYPANTDLLLVIEGNRRVAALRWIREDHEAGVAVPAPVLEITEAVPVLVVDPEADDPAFFEALMGIRHVSGIKQWGGYQRAKLVAVLKDQHGMESADVAERLAMATQEVNRRYRAYKALEQMQEDETHGSDARPDMYPLFHEAVALPAVRNWIGWDDNTGRFLPGEKLNDFYGLMTKGEPDDGEVSQPKMTTYQEVRALKDILPNEQARTVLLDAEHTLLDAVTIARRAEISRSWKAEVATAISALQSIAIVEFAHLSADDVTEIEKLGSVVTDLLENYRRLNA